MVDYWLFKLSSFLRLTKSVPCNGITCDGTIVDLTEDIDLNEMDISVEKQMYFSLNHNQIMELYKHYKLTQPDTVSSILVAQYEQETKIILGPKINSSVFSMSYTKRERTGILDIHIDVNRLCKSIFRTL